MKRNTPGLILITTDLPYPDLQADTVITIQQGFQPGTREAWTDQSMSDVDKRAKMKAISEERNKRFEAYPGKDIGKR